MSDLENKDQCYNCKAPITSKQKYCSNCGQKHHNGKYSVRRLIGDFLANNFNLDTKLALTVSGLMRPAFLTQEYFRGAHVKYFRPLRLFLFLNVFLIFIAGITSGGPDIKSDMLQNIAIENQKYLDRQLWDSLRMVVKTLDLDSTAVAYIDSIKIHSSNDSESYNTIAIEDDFMKVNFDGALKGPIEDSMYVLKRGVPTEEFLKLPSDELVDKYFEDFSWWRKLLLSKGLKLGLDVQAMLSFILRQLPIFLLIFTPFQAIVFILLYWKKGWYYVEHFVFTLHLGSFNFLLGVLFTIVQNLTNVGDWFAVLVLLIWASYFLFSLKRYYQENWGKTILKFILMFVLGGILGVIAFLIFLGISFLMF